MAPGCGRIVTSVPLYLGHEHACPYLPGREARMAFVDPDIPLTRSRFSLLVANGFRRSGGLVYRPYCSNCSACVPVRIPVDRFRPNRVQRRIQQRNVDLRVIEHPAEYHEAHYRLYLRYLKSRHPDSDMGEATPEDYLRFLGNPPWGDTRFIEFCEADRLLAVAVVDGLDDGFSSVYTFYDPDEERRSLGTGAILWQISEVKRRGGAWVYLGFWVAECRKMAYKSGFRPIELLTGKGWVVLDKAESAMT